MSGRDLPPLSCDGRALTFATSSAQRVPGTSMPQAPGAAEQLQQPAGNKVTLGVWVPVGHWEPALWVGRPFPDISSMNQGLSPTMHLYF